MKLSNARDNQYKQNLINKMGSPPSSHLKEGTKPSRSGGEPTYIKPFKIILCLTILWSLLLIDFYFFAYIMQSKILCNLMVLLFGLMVILTIFWLHYIKQYRNHGYNSK